MQASILQLGLSLLGLLSARDPLAADPSPEVLPAETPAPSADKQPMDHAVYERWRLLEGATLSRDGQWFAYRLDRPDGGDTELRVRSVEGREHHSIHNGRSARFDPTGQFLVARVPPTRDAVRAAEEEGTPKEERPKTALALLTLRSGQLEVVERVKSFKLPEESSAWVAYVLEPPLDDADTSPSEATEGEQAPESPEGGASEDETDPGDTLVVRPLAGGNEFRVEHVESYAFDPEGRWLAYTLSTGEPGGTSIGILALEGLRDRRLEEGEGDVRHLSFHESKGHLAYLTNLVPHVEEEPAEEEADATEDSSSAEDDDDEDEAPWRLALWSPGQSEPVVVAASGTPGIPGDREISSHRAPSFSEDASRLYFGTAPPAPEEPEEIHEDDKAVVDVWSWTDIDLQPAQKVNVERERNRSYLAVARLDARGGPHVLQLGTEELPEIRLSDEGNGDVAFGTSDEHYRIERSWDIDSRQDVHLVNVESGRRRLVLEGVRGWVQLSPGGHWLTWWDGTLQTWFALDTSNARTPVDLGAGIPHPLQNELHDAPSLPRGHGIAGWLEGDRALLINDRYDLWLVDPRQPESARCVTEGMGRANQTRLRHIDLDTDEPWVDASRPLLLSGFNERDKSSGFLRDRIEGNGSPTTLLWSDHSYSTPVRAKDADRVHFTRSSFEEFPDAWVSRTDFQSPRRLSDANPQQAEYLWGSAELIEWRSTDGVPLQGILYKPEGFDPEGSYPLLTYFYERRSDALHTYSPPHPHRSTIRFSFYTSRGYAVFVPDIPYTVGYPGRSAMHAVMPGIARILEEGWADPERLGVQGHSWGGYQIAYMVTQTDLFAAAIAGAPVANMTSAYGGIRWRSGMSRMFQYEKTQSRIGSTLWEATQRYIDNSPVFQADHIDTPLLILHNDKDGAVPWYQGIEMFVAMRRLGKPSWMLNYNGEPHWPTTYPNKRDYAIRMQQFFDHYLMGDPMPRWMAEGVPAVRKGIDLGLDLVPQGSER